MKLCSRLTVEALQDKTCQDSLLSGGGTSLRAKISGGRGRPLGIFFGFYKTRHILLSDSANCTVLRAVVLTQYWRVTDGQTDGQTDGIAMASTVLAMRALLHAVKSKLTLILTLILIPTQTLLTLLTLLNSANPNCSSETLLLDLRYRATASLSVSVCFSANSWSSFCQPTRGLPQRFLILLVKTNAVPLSQASIRKTGKNRETIISFCRPMRANIEQ